MEFTVNIQANALVEAINTLAAALESRNDAAIKAALQKGSGQTVDVPVQIAPPVPAQITQPIVPVAPPVAPPQIQASIPLPPAVPAAAPIPVAPPQAPAVPTAAPVYTIEALAKAGAALAQSGKMNEALALLTRYGVQTVNQLKPEQYGTFATELRALGAQI